jgi:hypothetical protein
MSARESAAIRLARRSHARRPPHRRSREAADALPLFAARSDDELAELLGEACVRSWTSAGASHGPLDVGFHDEDRAIDGDALANRSLDLQEPADVGEWDDWQ